MHVEIKRILTPTDFSESAQHAMTYGASLAQQFGAELHVLHVLRDMHDAVTHPDFTAHGEQARAYFGRLEEEAVASGTALPAEPDEDESVHAYLRQLESGIESQLDTATSGDVWSQVNVIKAMRYGNPVSEICRYALKQHIDLIVLGTHGRTGLKHLLIGSVTERVVRAAPCPTLAVREHQREFVVHD